MGHGSKVRQSEFPIDDLPEAAGELLPGEAEEVTGGFLFGGGRFDGTTISSGGPQDVGDQPDEPAPDAFRRSRLDIGIIRLRF